MRETSTRSSASIVASAHRFSIEFNIGHVSAEISDRKSCCLAHNTGVLIPGAHMVQSHFLQTQLLAQVEVESVLLGSHVGERTLASLSLLEILLKQYSIFL